MASKNLGMGFEPYIHHPGLYIALRAELLIRDINEGSSRGYPDPCCDAPRIVGHGFGNFSLVELRKSEGLE